MIGIEPKVYRSSRLFAPSTLAMLCATEVAQKDSTPEAELEKAAEALYGKYVPAGVREFIELNAESKAAAKPKKPRPAPSSAVGVPSPTGR